MKLSMDIVSANNFYFDYSFINSIKRQMTQYELI